MRTQPGALRGLLRSLVGVLLPAVVAGVVPRAALAQAQQTVAVLPLQVHAMDDQDYLQAGLADMLASRLGRTPRLGVIRVDDLALATHDVEAARAAGRKMGADWVLFGSFTRFGDGASLDVRCVDTRGEAPDDARSVFVQAGRLGDIIPQLDGLSEKVARFVASGGTQRPDLAPADPDEALAQGEAGDLRSQLEALRARVEALESETSAAAAGQSGAPAARGEELARELR